MGEQKETITINRVHDNDKYVITRTIKEEMTGDELLKTYDSIRDGIQKTADDLEIIPKQAEDKTRMAQKVLNTLKERLAAFTPHAHHLRPEDPELEPHE